MRTRRLLNAASRRTCFVLLLLSVLPCVGVAEEGPELEFVHTPPRFAPPLKPLQIRGQIYETPPLKDLVLRFRAAGAPDWQEVDFVQESADTWVATIPASYVTPAGDVLAMEYYVSATGFDDRSAEVYASEANPIRVPIDIPRPEMASPSDDAGTPPASAEAPGPTDQPTPEQDDTSGGVDEPQYRPAPAQTDAGPAAETVTQEPDEKAPEEKPSEEARLPPEKLLDSTSAAEPKTGEEAPPPTDQTRPEKPSDATVKPEEQPARQATQDLPLEEAQPGSKSEPKESPTPAEAPPSAPAPPPPLPPPAAPPPPEPPIALAHVETSAEVTALGSDLIRRLGLQTLAELMALVPGVSVSRDVQGFWHVAVNGRLDDAGVLVFYDGQRMNNPYDGRVNWEMSLENVDRVLVQTAPSPVEYGPGAFAVIQIIPTRREGLGAAIQPGLDGTTVSTGAVSASANGGHDFGRWKLFGDFDVELRGGYRAPIAADAISTSKAGVTNDERQFYGGGIHFDYDLGSGAAFFLNLRGSGEQRGALVGAGAVVGPQSSLGWDTGFVQAGVRVPVARWILNGQLSCADQFTNRSLEVLPANVPGLGNAGGITLGTAANLSTVTASFSAQRPSAKGNLLTLGAVFEEQGVSFFQETVTFDPNLSSAVGDFNIPPAYPAQNRALAWRSLGGISALDEWNPLPQLAIRGGIRGDVAGDVPGPALLPAAEAGLVWHAVPSFQLSAAASYASRLPTFEELLSVVPLPPSLSGGLPMGYSATAPLKPMEVVHAELGGFFSREVVPDHHLVVRATGFYNRFEDPIEVVAMDSGFEIQNRPGGTQYFGVEGELRYSWTKYLSAFGNISWQRGQDLTQAASLPQFSWLTTNPQLRVNGGILGALPRVGSLAVTVTYGSERRNDTLTNAETIEEFDIPAYVLLSATIRTVRYFGWLELAATVSGISVNGPYVDPVPRPDLMPGLLPRDGVHGSLSARVFW
jgi:hypothetical protein